jgi:hypothetical protein
MDSVDKYEQVYEAMFQMEQELEELKKEYYDLLAEKEFYITNYLNSFFKGVLTKPLWCGIKNSYLTINITTEHRINMDFESDGTVTIKPNIYFSTFSKDIFLLTQIYYELAKAVHNTADLFLEIQEIVVLLKEKAKTISQRMSELSNLKHKTKRDIYAQLRQQAYENMEVGDQYFFPNVDLHFKIIVLTAKLVNTVNINTGALREYDRRGLADRIVRESSTRSLKIAEAVMDTKGLKVNNQKTLKI